MNDQYEYKKNKNLMEEIILNLVFVDVLVLLFQR